MNRSDSGFEESHLFGHPKRAASAPEHGTTSSAHPETALRSPKSPTISEATEPKGQPRTSEKGSSGHRRSRDQRRKSIQSSTNTSTKSRDRGYSSKPSSRRTSCTLVDPSRPSRHYRVKSAQSVSTANRDIDDVLALHFRSCSLFQNSTYHSKPLDSNPRTDGISSTDDSPMFHAATCPTTHYLSDGIYPINTNGNSVQGGTNADGVETITTHWLSPSTRKREYEKIDRAHSGVLGLVRRVLPRSVSGPLPPQFYEKDKSDVGSVRRYRMDMSDDEDEVDKKDHDKQIALRRQETVRLKTVESRVKGKRWDCF